MSLFEQRTYGTTITQLPQRDEALMFGMEPGFSNSKAVEPADVEDKVLDTEAVEDKAVKPAAKRTAKKS